MLSSMRLLVFPRLSTRWSITGSEHSKYKTNLTLTLLPHACSHRSKISKLRGKPSRTNRPPSQPRISIAARRSGMTTSTGTSFPCFMHSLMSSPYSDPGLAASSRSKLPGLRWWKRKDGDMRLLCVPLPEPGPPRINTTVGAKSLRTSSHTWSVVCSALILRRSPEFWKTSITGIDSALKVTKRFRMDSMLSSTRPLVFPRSRRRASITSSPHSRVIAKSTRALDPTTRFQPSQLSKLRGKPSTK
mmetsp:Transcript_47718/g.139074  ORF Transcript_47718/g.139074 Transcript_47718/m.139074 type:complete len:245 (+) Transcript_47718:3034-3768(+)